MKFGELLAQVNARRFDELVDELKGYADVSRDDLLQSAIDNCPPERWREIFAFVHARALDLAIVLEIEMRA